MRSLDESCTMHILALSFRAVSHGYVALIEKSTRSVNDIVTSVATEVTEIYNTASIPTIAFNSFTKKVQRLIDKGNDLQKYPDPVATGKLQNLEERKRKTAKFQAEARRKMSDCSVVSEELEMPCSSDIQDSEAQDSDDSNIVITDDETSESDSCSTSGPKKINQYPELCKAIDQANVSNRDADLPVIDDLHAAFSKTEQLYSSTYLSTDFPLFMAAIGDVSEGVVS